ncbi:MAG TPA: heavy metal translocating P-type ATPase, partial [Polyangiaceae bacterium]
EHAMIGEASRALSERSTGPRAPVFSSADCAHCGLPVTGVAGTPDDEPRFCCNACSTAYAIIHDAGLGAYYLERSRAGASLTGNRGTGRGYTEYDDPRFRERHVRAGPSGAAIELFVEGIHCTSCVWLLERLPRLLPGVRSARLDVGRGALDVEFDPARVLPSRIAGTLDGLGYRPHPSSAAQRAGDERRDRALLIRLGVAGALAGNVMLMALALYSGAAREAEFALLFRWGSLLLSIPAVFWAGAPFLRGGLAALRTRAPHMDLPISIGILTGFARSASNTLTGSGEVYFDTIAVLIFLLLVGRWLQHRHARGATRVLDLIAALAPGTARRVDGERVQEVPSDALEADCLIEVAAEERVPVDGIVVSGASSVDTSWLTGESLPEEIRPGQRVYAGTRNLSGTLRVRVEVAGEATRLGRLMRSVIDAQSKRAPIVRLADRVSGYFVFVVLALSALTFVLWSILDPARAVDNAVALLVVTCPCALGMATPLAVSAALRRAARAGIFFKGGEFLEALARPGLFAFDKTGTLTEGKLALVAFAGDASVKPLILAAERRSPHPIGRALVAALNDQPELAAESVREEVGRGVSALVSGHQVKVGSAEFVSGGADGQECWWRRELEAQAALGRPSVACSVDGEVRAVAAFSDPVREDALASLEALRARGYDVAILSGDRAGVVRGVAESLGPFVAAEGALSPEQKLEFVKRARSRGPVFMVGDGVNDAAAMSAADVALAVHGGAEASLVAADAFTTLPGVGKIVEAVLGARRTLAAIRRGIVFSLVYNVAGVVLCMAGWISPLFAAVLMPLSSLTVVTNALRARTFVARETPRPARSSQESPRS